MKKEDIVRVLAAVLQFSGLSAASEPQWGGYTKQKIGSTPRNCTNSFEEIAHGFRLVARSLADLAHPQRMSLEDTLALVRTAQPFADVTNTHCAIYSAPSAAAAPETYTAFFSPPPSAQRENAELTAAAMVGNASAHSIARWMAQLTSIDTRHPHTRGGLRASKAVFDACRRIVAAVGAEGAAARVVTSLRKVTHTNMLQYSVILRVEPKRDGSSLLDSNASDPSPPVVILAANLDSFNLYNPMSGGSPGANDNASGCATIFEVLRLIISFGYIPKRPIEFHWYAGSQLGLKGSQQIALEYFANNVRVAGMFHVARTGWDPMLDKEHPRIAIASDADQHFAEYLLALSSKRFSAVKRPCG